jgi:hypothetical protein
LREEGGQTVEGWGVEDLLGWFVLYHPGMGTTELPNFASLFADIPIPYREIPER